MIFPSKKSLGIALSILAIVGFAGYAIYHGEPANRNARKASVPEKKMTSAESKQLAAKEIPAPSSDPKITTTSENKPTEAPPPEITPEIKQGNDVYEKVRSILALRSLLTEDAVQELLHFLEDDDDSVKGEAIDALGYIGLNAPSEEMKREIFEALLTKATDTTYWSRSQALLTAAMFGYDDRILPVISAYVEAGDEDSMEVAVRAMSFVGSQEAYTVLNKVIQTSDETKTLQNAMSLLMRMGTPESLATLREVLTSDDERQQELAMWALSRNDDPAFQEILINAISQNEVNQRALETLARSASGPEVFGELFSKGSSTQEEIIDWLAIISKNTSLASMSVRNRMAEEIGTLVNNNNEEIVLAAVKALGSVASTEDQTAVLEPKLQSKDFLLQGEALNAYMQYCSPSTYKPLLDLYWDNDEQIRRTAFFFSEQFLNQSDLAVLEKASEHPEDEFIREHSKKLIRYITGS